jgi:hypothetical protein
MPPTICFAFIALAFGFLALIFLTVFIIGLIAKSRLLKIIGGFPLAVSIGMVFMAVTGTLLYVVMIFVTDELPRTRTKPEIKDLAGVYRVSKQTGTFVHKINTSILSEMSITLREDGSFKVNSIPLNSFKNEYNFCSGTGTWKLERDRGWHNPWVLTLSFTESKGSDFENGRFVCINLFQLRNRKAPYIIYIILGDPDEGRGLKFEKINNEKP